MFSIFRDSFRQSGTVCLRSIPIHVAGNHAIDVNFFDTQSDSKTRGSENRPCWQHSPSETGFGSVFRANSRTDDLKPVDTNPQRRKPSFFRPPAPACRNSGSCPVPAVFLTWKIKRLRERGCVLLWVSGGSEFRRPGAADRREVPVRFLRKGSDPTGG